jgi:hypothetical protein
MQGLDIGEVMVGLKRRMEQRDGDLFARYGFEKTADFIRFYQRLSVILVQNLGEAGDQIEPVWWQNNDSRHLLATKMGTMLRSLIQSDDSPSYFY